MTYRIHTDDFSRGREVSKCAIDNMIHDKPMTSKCVIVCRGKRHNLIRYEYRICIECLKKLPYVEDTSLFVSEKDDYFINEVMREHGQIFVTPKLGSRIKFYNEFGNIKCGALEKCDYSYSAPYLGG